MEQRRLVAALALVVLVLVALVSYVALRPAAPESVVATATAGVATGTVATDAAPAKRAGAAATRTRWERKGPGSVVGIVREYGTDRPLADVDVVLEAGLPGPNELLKTKTRADGGFTFAKATNFDAWTLRVTAPPPLADLELAGVTVIENRESDVGTLYLAPAFVVPGVVVDERGAPVEGAQVRAVRTRTALNRFDLLRLIRELPSRPPAVDTATSGADGKFELRKVPPGTYDFTVEKQGFQIRVEAAVVITPRAKERPLRFVLAHGFAVDGRVVREGEGPIAGLTIVAFRQPRDETDFSVLDKVFTATDEKGAFRLEGLAGGRHVVAVTPEDEPIFVQADVEVPTRKPVELRIRGDAWLEGRVTGDGDRPVPGAQVYAASFRNENPVVANVRTDADGRYVVRGLQSGPLQLFLVQAEGYGMYPEDVAGFFRGRQQPMALQPGRNVKDVTLGAGGVVKGVVRERGTETPVAGARVELGTAAAIFGGSRGATTDAEGRFEITSVPKGRAVLLASKDGWFQPGVSVLTVVPMFAGGGQAAGADPGKGAMIVVSQAGEVLERTLELARGSTLGGVVTTPDGQPAAGAQVSLSLEGEGGGFQRVLAGLFPTPEPRLTDAEGRFELPGPPPGQKARVVARAAGWLDGRSDPLALAPGDARTDLVVKLRQGATLAGRVRDDAGRPVDGALVRWLAVADGDQEWSIRWRLRSALASATDAEGKFTVGNVETGRLAVQVTDAKHMSWSSSDVRTEDGRTVELDVTLPGGGAVEGRVVGSDGRPRGGARVDLQYVGDPPEGIDPFQDVNPDTTTDASGAFRFDGIVPGAYRARASAEGAAPSDWTDATAGGPPLTLRLAQAFSIGGIVRQRGGGPVGDVVVRALRPATGAGQSEEVAQTRTGAQGEFTLEGLPAGTYVVSMEQGWGSPPRPNVQPVSVADVPAGRQGLLIEADPGLTIAGTVTLADGRPAAAGYVWAQRELEPGERPAQRGGVGAQIEEGRFELAGLEAGRWRLNVNADGAAQRQVVVAAGTRDVSVDLGGGGTVRGRVTRHDAQPAAGVRVIVSGPQGGMGGQTDAEGRYEIKGIAEGTYTVAAWYDSAGAQYFAQADGVQVRNGGTETVDLACQKRP